MFNIKFSNNINYNEKYDAIICDYESDRVLNKFFAYDLPIYCYSPNFKHEYFFDVVGKINTSEYVKYCISFSNLEDLNQLINQKTDHFRTDEFKKFLEYEFGISKDSDLKFSTYVGSLSSDSRKNIV